MHRLLRIGFQNAGYWLLDTRHPGGIAFRLRTAAPYPHTLYAFVVGDDVKYVGKTTKTLGGRMNNYVNGLNERAPGNKQSIPEAKAASTNARVARLILDTVRQGNEVTIFALPDVELHQYGDFHLNMAAGLEDSIIRVMKPAWNGGIQRRRSILTTAVASSTLALPHDDHRAILTLPVRQVIQVKIGPAYRDNGFFNIGVQGADYLGEDGDTIRIYCEDNEEPILGLINRRANSNHSPRIFGGRRLREWIQRQFEVDKVLKVEVLTSTAIRLSALAS